MEVMFASIQRFLLSRWGALLGGLIIHRILASGEAARKLHERLYPARATGSDLASTLDNM